MINKNEFKKSLFNKTINQRLASNLTNNRIIKFEMRQKLQTKEV